MKILYQTVQEMSQALKVVTFLSLVDSARYDVQNLSVIDPFLIPMHVNHYTEISLFIAVILAQAQQISRSCPGEGNSRSRSL